MSDLVGVSLDEPVMLSNMLLISSLVYTQLICTSSSDPSLVILNSPRLTLILYPLLRSFIAVTDSGVIICFEVNAVIIANFQIKV